MAKTGVFDAIVDVAGKALGLDEFIEAFETKGDDLVTAVLLRTKRNMEYQRKQKKIRFRRIRRMKSGRKRFIAQRAPIPVAEPLPRSFQDDFNDIFRGS